MDLSLRPATVDALQRFRARHNALLWRQARLLWLVLGLAALLLIALLDRAMLLPEAMRPWCSLAVYVGGLVAAWRLALRFLQSAEDRKGSARLAESAAPEVREKLLAAVELSQQDPATIKDSVEFRARLQDEVSAAVRGVDWQQRLPASALKPWRWRLAIVVAAAVGLSFVPRLHLAGFLARAALPFANLERPSSVKIEIEAPAPASGLAAIASEVNLAVRITGESVDQAFIEYGEAGASTRRMELGKVAPERFEGRLPVGQGDVRYRVRASDGLTAWHTLSARARPRITQFTKTIVPPAYVGGPPAVVKEDHGDLEVLEGSTVKLAMQANQPVKEARIILNPEMPTHPAAPGINVQEQGKLAAELLVDGNAEAWTVQMKSAETGFSNDEAASWRITVVPDLPPLAQITLPVEQQVSLLPDESLRITGTASDDVGLKSVQLALALNGENWKNTDLPFKPGKEAIVEHLLAMAPLQVKSGDTVLIKLVATDLKGQKAESSPLRILILEQTVDPAKRAWAAEARRLAEMAMTLEEKTREVTKAMATVQKVARAEKKGKPVTDDAHAQLARAKQQIERANEQAADVWEELKKAAQAAPTRLNAEEAKLLGAKVAQLRHDSLRSLEENTRDGVENPEILKRDASVAYSIATTLHEAAKAFATEDTARITQQATEQLARQQALLTETSLNGNRDQSQRSKWQEQQRAALAANGQLKNEFANLKEQVHGGHQANLDRMQKEITEAANDLNESLDKQPDAPNQPKDQQPPQPKSPEHLYGASDNLHQRLARSADAIRAIADEAAHKASDFRQRLQAQDNPALAAIDQAKAELTQAAAAAKAPQRNRDRQQQKDGLTHEERAGQQLQQAARQLQDQAELREQNPLTNTQAALDENRASRAAEKLQQETAEAAHKNDPNALEAARAKATDLAKIARTLDADQLAQEATEALTEALTEATSPQPQSNEREDLARNAEAAQQAADQLKQLPQALRRTESPKDLANTAQQAADQARSAAQQLQDQQRQAAQRQPNQPAPPQNQPPAVADAQAKARQVADALAPQVEDARKQLGALAPKVSEMMHQVAKDLHETQKQTEAAKQDADAQKPVEAVAQKAQDIQPEAAKNAEKMNTLQAALRQEANAAQLAKADQRQLARTADVALEQMRQKSPEIAQNLKQAARATQSQPQAQSLQKAAQAQQQTAEALQQLANNFAKMEKGEEVPPDALAQLEQMEKDLGVQQPLDEAYDKAKELADVSQDAKNDPQKALAELENQLHKSPAMQKALAEIAKTTAEKSQQQLAEKATQPAMLGTAAEDAGNNLERVARHEERLGQKDAAKQVKDASAKVNATAKATKTEPGNATAQVARETTAAAQAAAKSAEQAAAATPAQPNLSAFDQTQAHALAKALDELDAQLHPLNGGDQQQQGQQQGGQQQPGQQGAQQSLAQAQQSQQQGMAQDRAQGKEPGQQQGAQQTAQKGQGKGQAKPDTSQSPEEGGNFANTPGKEGVLVPINVVVDGNWGKLPAHMAEDLTEATRQEAAPEYRAAIENYYKAIASKAKK